MNLSKDEKEMIWNIIKKKIEGASLKELIEAEKFLEKELGEKK